MLIINTCAPPYLHWSQFYPSTMLGSYPMISSLLLGLILIYRLFSHIQESPMINFIPSSARPMPGWEFRKHEISFKKSTACRIFWDAETMKCWSCEAHQRMNRWWLRCQWHDLTWQNPCTADWLNEQTNQWINKSMNERTNERTNELMNGWTDEWMNEWMNKRTNERMNEWMNC